MAERKYRVWMDGRIVEPEQAVVSVFTQTAMRGANVYEGLRAYWDEAGGRLNVWKLEGHLDRLFQSMKIMRRRRPSRARNCARACWRGRGPTSFREDVHFRLVVYLGDGGSGGLKAFRPGEIELGACTFGGPRPHAQALEKGLHVAVSSWRRIADDAMPPRVKAGANYQNNRFAALQARTDGYNDALMLTREGKLAEGTGAAVMLARDGELVTPPVTSGVLESLTRKFILTLQERRGNRPPVQREVDRTELYIADEIFLCGTAEEVTPVVSVDRIPVSDGTPGPMTRQFQLWLWEAARSRDPEWREDLTPVT